MFVRDLSLSALPYLSYFLHLVNMAAELVGGAFLSSFLNVLFDRLSDPQIINLIRGKKLSEKMIQRFKAILNGAEALLNDAERRQIREGPVKIWLDDLKDAIYEADDFLDEIATKAATKKDQGNFLTRFKKDREKVTRMEDVIARLESIVNQKDTLGLKEIPMENMSWRTPSTSLVKVSDIYGRDEDKKALVKLLLDDANDGDVSVIPIVGMGGIGKTTLAQLVYNDEQVQQKFNVKAWVCVGEVFDVLKVTKTVVEKATCASCNMNDLDSVQQRLRTEVTGKRFLVVLDDMWTNHYDDWKTFLIPFQCGSQGGKILVTTRIDTVASMVKTIPAHNLSLLDVEQCWSVFANHAFFATESRDRLALEKVGRKIVDKCKGLPLAAQSLGGLLRTKDNIADWKDVLTSEIWEFPEDECRILPALRISYHYLPSYLKRCFVYCSLYPKDYAFNKDELVLLWMAEDLLQQPKSGSILEEVGYKYFNDLAARSFFQPSKDGYEDSFVMHDLMHDLATFYGEKFFVRISEHENVAQHDTKTRHLSYDRDKNNSLPKMLEACKSLSNVRTLFLIKAYLYGRREGIDTCRLLAQLKRLRVLSFASFEIDILPDSIGDLIHLRYLNLSNTRVVTLPESLNNLYNLQTLKLRECNKLKKLPSNMQNLVNLRHLDIVSTDLEEMPKKMSELKDLQFLSSYIAGKHEENGIGELGELAHLHGSFRLKKLENVKNSGEASNARMDEKIHLNALYLWWSWSSFNESEVYDSQSEKDVLDKLRPHKDLKELSISCYRGTMFPDWVGQSSYHNMTWLKLSACKNCWVLPSLGQLPSLTRLEISEFDMVKKIGGEFYKADATHRHPEKPFRSLKYVSFRHMRCLEEWESYECNDDDDAPFPQLEKLVLKNCPKLRGDLPTFLPSLKSLVIEKCEELGCYLPRAPIISELRIHGTQEARMRDLPLSLQRLRIRGNQLVEYVFEAMSHTQPTSLIDLHISECSSAISFPGDSLPPSLEYLGIFNCMNVEFPMQHQQHDSLTSLRIDNSCHSLTSFALPAFPNLKNLTIANRENLTSLGNIRLPASLRKLLIDNCPLLGEGIERKDPHIWPSISHIPHIQVDHTKILNDSTS
ncbi:putative disease resistance RPP13-like protein 1 [Arachis stenosperma]|uniref:putative disease resistance RPP13-like protein 1 n=1 Tax=Arachis stenosperma TaxID=217475 RepID=UPI0025AC7209|nr:putative disease resistance RPP13-like protein 1 [Arachis stenosperma]XP_057743316.1 putative disease resistance RPP13-like protein 1 [Arachis stenosperma]XP_057743317.1 putative disease resistance RPP13-like protein 1 [Arachis stenosperma]XP_057743318.1 putative disease resistance RPP13-like protein 1 [Arachis stenosperma]